MEENELLKEKIKELKPSQDEIKRFLEIEIRFERIKDKNNAIILDMGFLISTLKKYMLVQEKIEKECAT
jgi:hypothetical protein